MNPGQRSFDDDGSGRARSSSRREFIGRTIRGGALLAATTVLGDELGLPEGQAKSQQNGSGGHSSVAPGATTADLVVEKLVEWGVPVVFGLPGENVAQ